LRLPGEASQIGNTDKREAYDAMRSIVEHPVERLRAKSIIGVPPVSVSRHTNERQLFPRSSGE